MSGTRADEDWVEMETIRLKPDDGAGGGAEEGDEGLCALAPADAEIK